MLSSKFRARFKRHTLLNIALLVLCIKLYADKRQLKHELDTYLCISEKPSPTEKPNVNVFDLKQPLEPARLYRRIDCRESARFYTSVTICTHDYEKDVHVSGSILRGGVWEPHILSNLKKIEQEYIIL